MTGKKGGFEEALSCQGKMVRLGWESYLELSPRTLLVRNFVHLKSEMRGVAITRMRKNVVLRGSKGRKGEQGTIGVPFPSPN